MFLGMGLAGVNALRAEGEDAGGVGMRSISSPSCGRRRSRALPVGRRVVVIGGGMTAIDAAVQSKLLGAEEVTICYRRGKEHMNASEFEQDLAAAKVSSSAIGCSRSGWCRRAARSPASNSNTPR